MSALFYSYCNKKGLIVIKTIYFLNLYNTILIFYVIHFLILFKLRISNIKNLFE